MQKNKPLTFQTYIVEHPDFAVRESIIKNLLTKQNVQPVDILWLITQHSLTIAEVQKMIRFISFKPYASLTKAVILSGHRLTPEAQQALLKTLEESAGNNLFFIEVPRRELLLPTIISRAVLLNSRSPVVSEVIGASQIQFWGAILRFSLGDRLKICGEIIKDRSETILWLEEQIHFFRMCLISSITQGRSRIELSNIHLVQLVRLTAITRDLLEKNISVKLALDHLFLGIPQSPALS